MGKKRSGGGGGAGRAPSLRGLLRVDGPVDLRTVDPAATPGFAGDRDDARRAGPLVAAELADLQGRLYAEGRTGGTRSLLLVLQGMDGAGKGGAARHVAWSTDPHGVRVTGFGAPTAEERAHHFLWRIRTRLPGPGVIGVFDRSHYEDVLVPRVHGEIAPAEWEERYAAINAFEAELTAAGTRVVKCLLHISWEESRARQLARLDDPTKHWKFDPRDLDARDHWEDYLDAYQDALGRCSTPAAPWYVIPADRKWYRNWAISRLLIEELRDMGVAWPAARFDMAHERRRLLAQRPPGGD